MKRVTLLAWVTGCGCCLGDEVNIFFLSLFLLSNFSFEHLLVHHFWHVFFWPFCIFSFSGFSLFKFYHEMLLLFFGRLFLFSCFENLPLYVGFTDYDSYLSSLSGVYSVIWLTEEFSFIPISHFSFSHSYFSMFCVVMHWSRFY